MAWNISERFPSWGETGEFPAAGFFYEGGDQVNEKHMDALWNGINGLEEDVQSALNDIDSDGDGVVDEADYANDADASTYKNNDIDSDGDGKVDSAEDADTVGGEPPSNFADTNHGNEEHSTDFTTLADVNNNADVPNADFADNAGDADTVDGQDAIELQLTVDDDGIQTNDGVTLIDFGVGVTASQTGTGSVEVQSVVATDHPYDLLNGTLEQTVDISSNTSNPSNISIRHNDGYIYISDSTDNAVHQFTYSDSITGATYVTTFSPDSYNQIDGVEIANGGTELYMIDRFDSTFYQYSLSTPHDLSTASAATTYNFSNELGGGRDISWGDGGNKAYAVGQNSSDPIVEYDAGTAYDVSTLTQNGTYSIPYDGVYSVDISDDGGRVTITDSGTNETASYLLSTAYDVTTASLDYTASPSSYSATSFSDGGVNAGALNGTTVERYIAVGIIVNGDAL